MATMTENVLSHPENQRLIKKYEDRLQLAESLIKEKRGLDMTFERKLSTAICLENTTKRIRALEANIGATQPGNVGQYKRYAIDMVGTIIPNLIAQDLVSVQAIENRVGMINVLQYAYGSDKGAVKAGDVFASPFGYDGTQTTYTAASVDGEAVSTEDGTAYLAYTPIRPGTLRVLDAAGQVVTDVVLDDPYTGAISGLTAGEDYTAYYIYDNESVPVRAPQIKMDIKSIPVTAQARKLSALWSFDAAYELNKEYGQDMQDLLAAQAAAEINAEIDREVTGDLYRIANAGPEVVWSRVQPLGVSAEEHYASFQIKIVEGSNEIFAATKRCRANFLVGGINVDSVLKCVRGFQAHEDASAIGPRYIGTLPSGIKCYTDPHYDADSFVLGYKGTNLMDTGYVYCPYMPVMTTGMVTLEDFASRQGWATMYGKKAVNPRMYVKGRIDG